MPRRKRDVLEDDDSDSSVSNGSDLNDADFGNEDPDTREERALFEDPYKRKRRRKGGKDDAIYGVFASSDEDEGFVRKGKSSKPVKRSDWTKAPSFVSKATVDITKDEDDKMDLDAEEELQDADSSEAEEEDEDDDGAAADDEDALEDIAEDKPPSPRVREVEDAEEERPRFGGLGLGKSKTAGIGSGGGFSSFSRGGIGSSRPAPSTEPEAETASTDPPIPLPSTFGAARAQRSFLRNDSDSPAGSGASTPKVNLNPAEKRHFAGIRGSFGARMLEKMGWEIGTGLGTTGEGIVTPVESKLRPKGAGIAFGGFKEKTEQSKAEARRRGEAVSDDEEDKPKKGRKGKGQPQATRSDAWKKPKRTKVKIEHKSYEQIIAEAGEEASTAGVGPIIDATGATLREVSSIADISRSGWAPTADPTRLPELRHNLRLINESCKGDLDGLAREARALAERKKWVQQEDIRLRKQVEQEAELISRLQQVHLVVDDISKQSKELSVVYEASIEPFTSNFDKLIGLFPNEFEKYRLDEIVIAAIAPIFRRIVSQWNPLENPSLLTSELWSWRRALKMTIEEPSTKVETYGSTVIVSSATLVEKPMTPYESLIWSVWLPKVRTCINNDWSPEDPQPAIRIYEAWSSLLPPFVRDNFFDQLVLPKVQKAVSDWSPKKHKVPLQTLVFPWLPHVGLRLEEVLGDARRKVKTILRSWMVADGLPEDLKIWKDVFSGGEWDTMLLKYVVPKLGARLREDFRVNPRQQDVQPLRDVLAWEPLLRQSILVQLLETGFFPKWLDVLHVWLIQPKVSFEEVRKWYNDWKEIFPLHVQNAPTMKEGFLRALQLMNKAMELGPEAPTKLPRPDHKLTSVPSRSMTPASVPAKVRPARTQEITFRSIVEDFASQHNLLFIPTGKAHEVSRMPLFRVSQSVDGKGGLLVYIQDDAVWAPDGDTYRAITMQDMIVRATQAS